MPEFLNIIYIQFTDIIISYINLYSEENSYKVRKIVITVSRKFGKQFLNKYINLYKVRKIVMVEIQILN